MKRVFEPFTDALKQINVQHNQIVQGLVRREHWACRPFYSPFLGEVTNQITKSSILFSVLSHRIRIVLYNSDAINILHLQSQLNYTKKVGDLKQKNWLFEIGDFIDDITPKKW